MPTKKNTKDDEFARHTPQNIYDQGEARQVGGTVMHANLNRDEYNIDRDRVNERRGGDDSVEAHNYNELDPENPAYVDDEDDEEK